MQGFDPAAATQAYLATLTPAQHALAKAYTQGGHWLLLWGTLAGILVSWIVIQSGVLVRVRHGVEAKRPHPWLAVLAVVAVDSLLEGLLTTPWDAYAHWWREKSYGLTSQAFAGWLSQHGLSLVLGTVEFLILLSLLYALIRRAPRTWWLWSGLLVGGGFILALLQQPVLIEPLFNSYKPAPPGPMRDEVVAMGHQVGVPTDKILIYDGSQQSNRYTANVAGVFGTARVAMSDAMFKKGADLAEVRGVVGHEMGHYVRGHIYIMAAETGLLAMIIFFLVDRLFPWTARLMGASGVAGIADPAGYPVASVLFSVIALIATPLTNTASRWGEADADRFSLEHFNEPDGMARALVKTVEYRAATPSKLEEFIFYNHPAVGTRIRRAMDWKATHPPTPPSAPPAAEEAPH
ncbi:MAG TPA: M48 family metalloprotease [Phenylobacterium sp.]|jgi:STE24 endopeptidase|uniref:M48 family metalloprotease n=1 Tax=Phenylobacterium sp. TaxID=1871053 RepID=UPI002D43C6D6|nr:M48 family metalloprotease [Phenylobacterium sp.]HZZ69808.1 M48 family metalloprotease [Phenylobacterium sp.]